MMCEEPENNEILNNQSTIPIRSNSDECQVPTQNKLNTSNGENDIFDKKMTSENTKFVESSQGDHIESSSTEIPNPPQTISSPYEGDANVQKDECKVDENSQCEDTNHQNHSDMSPDSQAQNADMDNISENACHSDHNGYSNSPNGDEGYSRGTEIRNGNDNHRETVGVQSPRPSSGQVGVVQGAAGRSGGTFTIQENEKIDIRPIPIGDPKIRSKIRFEVVTARVIETAGKKHVAYTIMMKRVGHEPHPAVIERRYSDFCFVYECILRSFHPSILGDFMFPKKVLIGNFKAEVISERTDAFHKFLNLIANCDNLLYSDYFYSFLSSEEHNEAVSHLKLARYTEAIPLLESIFYVREKLLSVGSIHVLLCSCELVACLSADVTSGMIDRNKRRQEAYAFAQVAAKSFDIVYQSSNADEVMVAESLRIPYLKLTLELATELGQDKKAYSRQLSELRYAGVRLENTPSLLEVIRDRYIHRASHTSKIS